MAIRRLDLTEGLTVLSEDDLREIGIEPFKLSDETVAELEALREWIGLGPHLARHMLVD